MSIHKSQIVRMVYKIYKENLQGQYKFRKQKNETNLGPLMFLAALKLWESLILSVHFCVISCFFLFFSLAHNEPTLMHYWQDVLKVMGITGRNTSNRRRDS